MRLDLEAFLSALYIELISTKPFGLFRVAFFILARDRIGASYLPSDLVILSNQTSGKMEFMKLYDKKSKSQKMKFQTVSYFY
jgi:hypothetical protein